MRAPKKGVQDVKKEASMGAFKRFCDFCCGIALFVACFFLFREFMIFRPEGDPTLREKLKLFFFENTWRDYRPYLGLLGLLVLSLLVGAIARRWSSIGFAFAALPFLHVLSMLGRDILYERPMLYVLLTALPLVGNLFDAITRDRDDGRHRSFVLANVSSLLVLLFAALVLWRASVAIPTDDMPLAEMKAFDRTVAAAALENDLSFLRHYAIAYAVGIGISLCFCGAYWIDLILAALPLVAALRQQLFGTLGPHSELLLALMILCLVCRLALTVAGTGWKKKSKNKQ